MSVEAASGNSPDGDSGRTNGMQRPRRGARAGATAAATTLGAVRPPVSRAPPVRVLFQRGVITVSHRAAEYASADVLAG